MITDEEIRQFKEVALAATRDNEWWVGSHKSESIEDAKKFCGEMLQHNPENTELFMVYSQKEWSEIVGDDALVTALTGNGKNSENNAKFIALASPRNVLALLQEIENMRSGIASQMIVLHTQGQRRKLVHEG